MKTIYFTALVLALLFASCKQEPSLQKYFVENTEDKNFIALDVSPSILNIDDAKLSEDEKASLEAFEKMNILAFKLDANNKESFEAERSKVDAILKDDKYQELMKFGRGTEGASLRFVGDENNIEEFVLFANKKDMGFAVVRILGNDMNPTDVMNFMSVLQQSDMNLDQLKPLQDLFGGIQ